MLRMWIKLRKMGIIINFTDVVGMILRNTWKKELINAMIKAKKFQIDLNKYQLEAHYLVGGKVEEVVDACATLKEMGVAYTTNQILSIDLAKGHVVELVMSFAKVKTKYPDIQLEEFFKVYLKEDQSCN